MLLPSSANIMMCLILAIKAVHTVPTSSLLKYEEYMIEHEISATQAKNSVLHIDLNSLMIPPGCQICTQSEISYCLGKNLIADHCCCDKRYHEVLPYVPHTCYLGTQLCKPIVGDCIEYTRLRNCCCDKHVIQKWKEKSSASQLLHGNLITNLLLCLYTLYKAIIENT